MEEQILLAIDGSTKSTGYAIFKEGKLIFHGVITASSSNLFKRLQKMQQELEKLVNEYHPTRVVLEEVLPDDVRHNQTVYKALVYLQGYIRGMLDKYRMDAELIVASSWRKKCGIKTGAGIRRESLKNKDIAFVKAKYNIDVCDDEADAICIGHAMLFGVEKVETYDDFEII